MFPCSVIAIAGICSSTALSSSSSIRHAPSRSEYSECRCRWTNSMVNAECRMLNAENGEWAMTKMPKCHHLAFSPSGIRHSALTRSLPRSLPLDGGRRLRADVVHDAVDALHLVDDARGDRREELVRQARPIGRHAVLALHRANRRRVLVGARVAHHA